MTVIISKPANVRDLGPIAVDPLRKLVASISEQMWASEDMGKENAYFCFHHTQHIIFRFIQGNHDPEKFYVNPSWTIWEPMLLPVMQAAIRPYDFVEPVFPKAMLARLSAGQFIDLHSDGPGSNLRTHKIHIPLVTNPDVYFLSGTGRHHLAYGRAWEVNNVAPHGGLNESDTDRIHLIFEVFDRAAARRKPVPDPC